MTVTSRSKLRRTPVRGSHDWNAISRILDVGFLAHVGFCAHDQPLVIPTRSPITDDQLVGGVVIPHYVLRYDARLDGGASHSAENRRKRSGNES
jgi:hypothetical protein